MSDHDSFEDRMREIADQIARSMQRMSEVDIEDLAETYGVDAERARTFASAAGQWLSARLSGGEALFGQRQGEARDVPAPEPSARSDAQGTEPEQRSGRPGPHPLDAPNEAQGLTLSALDSGRWSVAPGSNRLAGSGEGSPPPDARDASDLVGDLRARDWITADGTLTLVGRHALARWCRRAEDPAGPSPATAPPQP